MRRKNEVLCAAAGRLAAERSEADKPAKAYKTIFAPNNIQAVPELAYIPLTTCFALSAEKDFTRIFLFNLIVFKLFYCLDLTVRSFFIAFLKMILIRFGQTVVNSLFVSFSIYDLVVFPGNTSRIIENFQSSSCIICDYFLNSPVSQS
jgi:hypothetical protein